MIPSINTKFTEKQSSRVNSELFMLERKISLSDRFLLILIEKYYYVVDLVELFVCVGVYYVTSEQSKCFARFLTNGAQVLLPSALPVM